MKIVNLMGVEVQLLEKLLGDLEEKYACAGCNDFSVENTPEMRLMVGIIEAEWENRVGVPKEDRRELSFDAQGNIMTMDSMVLEYFQRRFGIKKD